MREKLLIFLGLMVAVTVAATSAVQAAGDPGKGRQKAQTCLGCHGIPGYRYPGRPMFHVPKVGGQHEAYIAAALQSYKKGERDNPTMYAQAQTLSDQDIQDIAAFFAQVRD